MAAKKATATTAESSKLRRSSRRREPTHDQIAERAYLIHVTEAGGDEIEHWLRAERELRG
jgi:hypothetical protein